MQSRSLFHVHTYRCGHAENVPDQAYIDRAIWLGASDIWFSDHAPFPDNYFGNRMKYAELPEYIETLQNLKEKYKGQIAVHVGLEIEYLPSFDRQGYYLKLQNTPGLEFLLLGQHMAELQNNPLKYSFEMDSKWKNEKEHKAIGDAIVHGIRSGYFSFVAHPDRGFKRCKKWSEEMEEISKNIIEAAKKENIPLEQNEASKQRKRHYWKEFWNLADGAEIVHGLDAHFLRDLKLVEEQEAE